MDEEIDLSNVPEPEEQDENINNSDKIQNIPENNIDQQKKDNNKKSTTDEERKATLKRKMAEKRAARTGNRSQKTTQNIANIMNMPGMNEMMETMLKGR